MNREPLTPITEDDLAAYARDGAVALRRVFDGDWIDLLAQGGVSASDQLPYAYNYLGQVIAARADSMAFQDGYMALSVGFAVAAVCALILARSQPIVAMGS